MRFGPENLKKLATFAHVFVVCIFFATSLIIGANNEVGAEVVVEGDWETATTKADGGINEWDGPYIPSLMFISIDNPHAGTKSLKMIYEKGGTDFGPGSIKKFFSKHDELYVRWYEYYSTGWLFPSTSQKIIILTPTGEGTAGGPGPNLYVGFPAGTAWPAISVQYMADMEFQTTNFYQNQGAPTAMTPGRWVCFELQAKMNTPGQADGLFRLWVDDALVLAYLNRQLRGAKPTDPAPSDAKWGYLDVAGQYGESPRQTQFRWFDDLVISTQRVGCSPGVTDRTAPGPPSGVRVTNP